MDRVGPVVTNPATLDKIATAKIIADIVIIVADVVNHWDILRWQQARPARPASGAAGNWPLVKFDLGVIWDVETVERHH